MANKNARPQGWESRARNSKTCEGHFITSAMAPAEALLSRLEGVQPRGDHAKGPRSWVARCPSHDDRHPSLSVREFPDGSLSVYCFSHRCNTPSILSAVGLHPSDLFPRDQSDDYDRRYERRRLPPAPWRDIIRALRHHLRVVMIGAAHVAAGNDLNEEDADAIARAAVFLLDVIDEVGGNA